MILKTTISQTRSIHAQYNIICEPYVTEICIAGFVMSCKWTQSVISVILKTLEHRWLITDLYTCYCIVYGHSALKFDNFLTYSHCSSLRGHSKKLEISLCKNNRSKNFFSSRVIQPWNSLSHRT